MESKSSKAIWIFLSIAVIAVILIIGFTKKPHQESPSGEPIKIGFIGPLTGDAAAYGEPSRNGVLLAMDEINMKGGINGRKIELIIEDGKCEGKTALNAAQKLINVDKVKFIIGGACSSETMGFASFAEQNKVLVFSYGSSNPAITHMGDYIFRNAPSDLLGGSDLAKLVTKKGFTNVAMITENTDFAQGVRGVFKETFTGSLVSDEVFNTANTDFRTTAVKIKVANPDAVVINVQTGANGARLAKQLREAGITAQFFTFFVSGDDFVKSGPAVEGTYILDIPSLATDAVSKEAKRFVEIYTDRFEVLHSYAIFGAAAYDGINILADGFKKAGDDPDKIKQYIYDLPLYRGALGEYSFDENGDPFGVGYITKQVKNQTLVASP